MRAILNGVPEQPFPPPDGLVQAEIGTLSACFPAGLSGTRREWFIPGRADIAGYVLAYLELDSRSGQFADETTPPEYRVPERFLVLPPEAEAWARAESINLLDAERAREIERAQADEADSAVLRIISPPPGAIYQVSSSLPIANQRIRIEAAVPADMRNVRLRLNGEILGVFDGPPYSLFWTLEPGLSELMAEADMGDGALSQALLYGQSAHVEEWPKNRPNFYISQR